MPIAPGTVWSRGRVAQWMAGRGYYQSSGMGFWSPIRTHYTADLCEAFWAEHGQAADPTPEQRADVLADFVARVGVREALVIDPLANLRPEERWQADHRTEMARFLKSFPGRAAPAFAGGVWLGGRRFIERLRFVSDFWTRNSGQDQTLVLPVGDAQLCFCHHRGVHLWADRLPVAEAFAHSCMAVLGRCSPVGQFN